MSELPVEAEDVDARRHLRAQAPDWQAEQASDRRLSWHARLRLILYLLGLSRGRA